MINFVMTIHDHVENDCCFVPWLLGSHYCKAKFRADRSMNSVYSTVINFGMLGLLRRLHCLHIQLTAQAETNTEIIFRRLLKHQNKVGKNVCKDLPIAAISDDDILSTVKHAQARARLKMEELGIDNLLKKHSMWGIDVKIPGIDGGALNLMMK